MRALYSSSSSVTHHIFSPPRFQVVAFEQDSDRLSSHSRHQLALHRSSAGKRTVHRAPANHATAWFAHCGYAIGYCADRLLGAS